MIYLGLRKEEKENVIVRYMSEHNIKHVVLISPEKFIAPEIDGADNVTYKDTEMYVTFYRLLQEIDEHTLIVVNECLRTQNRYYLKYNCIRHYLLQAGHQLIFQQLPIIDTQDDFMILFDWDTKSQWKNRKFNKRLIRENVQVEGRSLDIRFNRIDVPTLEKTKKQYVKQREKAFNELGARDPHIVPRNLYLIGGKDKKAYIEMQDSRQLSLFSDNGHLKDCLYVARNGRLGNGVLTYRTVEQSDKPIVIVDLPHRFIDYSDFVQETWQEQSDVLVADLKVDEWYYQRYADWAKRVDDTYADIL